MIFDFVLAQREIIRTARKNTVSERKRKAQHHQAQRSGQGGRLQPTAAAEEESSATSVSEAVDYSKLARGGELAR